MSFVITLRAAPDARKLAEIEKTQPRAAGWGAAGFKTELENKFAKIWALAESKKLLGFIAVRAVEDGAELLNFAILPSEEGRGFGKALIKKMFEDLRAAGVKYITLEVAENNERAVNLYKKNGFEIIGTRKKFYSGVTDAFLMRVNL